jgi:hypothetical protein
VQGAAYRFVLPKHQGKCREGEVIYHYLIPFWEAMRLKVSSGKQNMLK